MEEVAFKKVSIYNFDKEQTISKLFSNVLNTEVEHLPKLFLLNHGLNYKRLKANSMTSFLIKLPAWNLHLY